jgi:hypothetical protein
MTLKRVLVVLLAAVLVMALCFSADARKKRRDGPDQPKARYTVQSLFHAAPL